MSTFEPEIDLLAIGAHPDDVEIACGGSVRTVTRGGGAAAIVDLTRGEAATRGTTEERLREAAAAAVVLGVAARDNLGLPDGALQDDDASRRRLAAAIRRHRPRILVAPYPEDDHPDHAAAGRLAVAANFLAGVGGYDVDGKRHRADVVLFYMMHRRFEPTLVVDVSAVYEERSAALACYRSQLHGVEIAPGLETNVGAPDFAVRVRARHRFFGEAIGVEFGEPFAAVAPPGLSDIRALLG